MLSRPGDFERFREEITFKTSPFVTGLRAAFDQARALDIAQKSSESYKLPFMPTAAAVGKPSQDNAQKGENQKR